MSSISPEIVTEVGEIEWCAFGTEVYTSDSLLLWIVWKKLRMHISRCKHFFKPDYSYINILTNIYFYLIYFFILYKYSYISDKANIANKHCISKNSVSEH